MKIKALLVLMSLSFGALQALLTYKKPEEVNHTSRSCERRYNYGVEFTYFHLVFRDSNTFRECI